jgi:ribosomal protein L24E
MQRKCEYCGKDFVRRDKQQIGRFCSRKCREKLLRKEQLKKYAEYLANETEDQKLAWLKKHYEKFVIKKENDCWDWRGYKSAGYGILNHRGKLMKAHRVSWILHHGKIPESLFVLHKCDTRHCSNPSHLFLGNQTDNMRDMAAKKRTHIRPKLTIEQVNEIRRLLNLGVTMARLARDYNVSDVCIWYIKHNKSWKVN